MIRNRFDFLSNSNQEKRLAVEYMRTFVKHLSKLQSSNEFKYFDFSYYASHTIESEIEYYSKFDLRYIGLSFLIFFCIFYFLLSFNTNKSQINLQDYTKQSKVQNVIYFFKRIHVTLMKNPMFLVVITVLQFIFTSSSSIGILSLFGIQTNSLLYSIFFVILSNWKYLVCLFLTRWKRLCSAIIEIKYKVNLK